MKAIDIRWTAEGGEGGTIRHDGSAAAGTSHKVVRQMVACYLMNAATFPANEQITLSVGESTLTIAPGML